LGLKTGSLLRLWKGSEKDKVTRVTRGGFGVVVQDGLYDETRNLGYGADIKDEVQVSRQVNPKEAGLEY